MDHIPDELVCLIFESVQVQDLAVFLCRVSCVCRRFQALANVSFLWRGALLRDFGLRREVACAFRVGAEKQIYQRCTHVRAVIGKGLPHRNEDRPGLLQAMFRAECCLPDYCGLPLFLQQHVFVDTYRRAGKSTLVAWLSAYVAASRPLSRVLIITGSLLNSTTIRKLTEKWFEGEGEGEGERKGLHVGPIEQIGFDNKSYHDIIGDKSSPAHTSCATPLIQLENGSRIFIKCHSELMEGELEWHLDRTWAFLFFDEPWITNGPMTPTRPPRCVLQSLCDILKVHPLGQSFFVSSSHESVQENALRAAVQEENRRIVRVRLPPL